MSRNLALVTCIALAATAGIAEEQLTYPPARRVEQYDEFHGTRVHDPYRWLETDLRASPEVAQWVEAQNALTARYLDEPAQRASIRQRLARLWNVERYSPPVKAGSRYAYLKNDGLQNHSVLYLAETPAGATRALLDPNQWSKDGTVALVGFHFTPDGRRMAYGVSESGADWQSWRVMDVETGRIYDETLRWMKFAEPAWTPEGGGFYYAGYDEPSAQEQFRQLNLNQKVYFHRVGTPQSEDRLIYERRDHPEWSFAVHLTDDGRYLIVVVRQADDDHFRILVRDLAQQNAEPVELVDNFDHQYYYVGSQGPEIFFLTDRDAPRRRLIALDARQSSRQSGREIVAQQAETMSHVEFVGQKFLCLSLQDASARVGVYQLDGQPAGKIELPAIGTATGFHGRATDTETFYSFANFTTPPTIYRYDLSSGTSSLVRAPRAPFEPSDYQVDQVFCSSRDGTRVGIFVCSKKGLARDGARPTLLYGYGGFGISITPSFSPAALAWMEMGGVYAVANLRGGGEYGEAWHAAGTRENKQHVFDDFIAAAEWLVDQKYTRSDQLAIQGASNGGLLVAAVMLQRPDLFGACISEVPVTDMLRFQHFTDGRFWVTDYGYCENEADFRALFTYSPYHNVREGTRYPPTLVMTADTDDRVVPMHSFKWVAALQRAQAGNAPILLRVATRGGHGGGKAVGRRIDEVTDQFLFLRKALHLP